MSLAKALIERQLLSNSDRDWGLRNLQLEYPNPNRRPSLIPYLIRNGKIRCDEDEVSRIEAKRQEYVTTPLIETVLADIHARRAILFVGAGFSIDASHHGEPIGLTGDYARTQLLDDIKREITETSEIQKFVDLPLAQLAHCWQRVFERNSLHDRLRDLCKQRIPHEPLGHHRILANLNCFPFIITTNWDRLIEKAFAPLKANGVLLNRVRRGEELQVLNPHATTLIKLHGDLDDETGQWRVLPSITDEDILALEGKDPVTYSLLRALVASYRIVVVGFYPRDYNFMRLLHFAAASLPQTNRTIALIDPSISVATAVPIQKPVHVRTTGGDFLRMVEDYMKLEGGNSGQAFREPLRFLGTVGAWAKSQRELAKQILNRFPNLDRVEVVRNSGGRRDTNLAVARRGAAVLTECARPRTRLALSCGSTLFNLIGAVDSSAEQFREMTLCSTTVTFTDEAHDLSPFGLVTLLGHRLRNQDVHALAMQLPSDYSVLAAPHGLREILLTAENRDSLKDMVVAAQAVETATNTYLAYAQDADLYFLGVGAIAQDVNSLQSYAATCLKKCRSEQIGQNPQALKSRVRDYLGVLERKEYVGDLMYVLFKSEGASGGSPEDIFLTPEKAAHCLNIEGTSRLFAEWFARICTLARSIPMTCLQRATVDPKKIVALIADGRQKASSISALLKIGIGNTLIIDQDLAVALIDISARGY